MTAEQGTTRGADVRAFLIADVRGYTRFTVQYGDEAAARLAAKFALIAREGVAAHSGDVIELRGDEVLAVFTSVRSAIRAAVDLQSRFARESNLDPTLPLIVGIGLDAGEAVPVEGGYRGTSLNLAARLCGKAEPGDVLVSETVANLAHKMDGIVYVDRGSVAMKGFAEPVRVIGVERSTGSPGAAPVGKPEVRAPSELPVGGFLGSLSAHPLVGRAAEVETLRKLIEDVTSAQGRFAVLVGEAGAGKTRLAQEATAMALRSGFVFAAASSYEPQEAVPFYPFLDLLATLYDECPAMIRADVPRHWPLLGRLLPQQSAGQHTSVVGFSSREEQQHLFWAVADFLRAIADISPVSIFLDDLQWSDASSLELLHYIAQHTRNCRVLIVGTYRDTEVRRSGSLERIMLALHRQRLLERIPVRRLDQADTGALLASTIGDADVPTDLGDLVYQYTDGNPFFVHEVSRALQERGDVYRRGGRWTWRSLKEIGIPDSIRAVVDQRVSGLTDRTREMLSAASVLGQTFFFNDLRALMDADEADVETAVDEAIAASILREGLGDSYAFNHALMQGALHASLSARRRRRLHLSAGETIERSRGDTRASELEWHFIGAGEPARALPYAVLVGDRAEAVFAHGDAQRHYETALDLVQGLDDRRAEAGILEKIGGLLTAVIRYDEALEALGRAAVMYRELGDWETEARVVAQIGRVHVAGGSLSGGIRLLTDTLQSLAGRPPGARCGVLSSLARLLYVDNRFEEALQCASEARALAEEAGDGGVRAEAHVTQGSSLAMLGRWVESVETLEDAVADADAAGDLFSACRGLQHTSGIYLLQGNLRRAREAMERSLALAVRMDNRRQVGTTMGALALFSYLEDNRDEAETQANEARTVMRALGGFWFSILRASTLQLTLSLREWEVAPASLRDVLQMSEADASSALRAERFHAEREIASGHVERAITRLRAVLNRDDLPVQQADGIRMLLADALAQSGDAAEADRMAEEGIRAAREQRLGLRIAFWQSTRARALVRLGVGDEARQSYGDALMVFESMPYPRAAETLRELWGEDRWGLRCRGRWPELRFVARLKTTWVRMFNVPSTFESHLRTDLHLPVGC